MAQAPLIYPTRADWDRSDQKRITLVGMSGLGKTYISNQLRNDGSWFHYSVDYRIGTHYMGEHIVDEFRRHAMKTPFLRELLMSDSIYIGSNITFDNLAPLSAFLGKPGNADKNGIPFEDYMRRQALHRTAEIAATCDISHFLHRAEDIYGYPNFVCDTSGSVCEVVDPSDRSDPVLNALASNSLVIWLQGDDAHVDTLVERFNRAPKPMYARAASMRAGWAAYKQETGLAEADIDPDSFIRWSYRRILDERLPLYQAIADGWGIAIPAKAFEGANSSSEILSVIGGHLPKA